ncbi:hypothetical protein V8B55DRAFT_1506641 [Mucor lusitanicus]|uniref:BSD domain-containing protein n=2 Tax=Mucor circinelloides f. lusitanicus TaxID=29924 RepID=A0A162R5T6_MUCCL|nr:hypothetical protein FB192DRAFT_1427546 [Mucor lusitanicus]OAD08590.1 hypothetical protein MUCCIDRAFT_76516 [Mucor lusitanicus CBS 277.49]
MSTEKEITNSTPSTPTSPSSFFGGSFFSSVTSSVNALSQTIQTKGIPEFNKRLNELQQRARDIPNQIATLQGDLESERASFVKSKKLDEKNGTVHQSRGSEPVAPWAGYQGYENEMKQAILDISKDERNFLIPPPEDTNFQFDLNAYSQSAQAALKEDKNLSHSRFVLVPQQVSEPTFWKNYFYRVTLAKQAVLSHPPKEQPAKSVNQDVLFDFKDEEEEEKEIKESTNDTTKQDETGKEDTKSDNKAAPAKADPSTSIDTTTSSNSKQEESYEGMEDWEIELRKAAI